MNQFSEFPFSTVVQHNLKRHGFETPTPVQAQAIPPGMAGRDLVATAQTGTGKTLAFLLPILEKMIAQRSEVSGVTRRPIRALVLSPTRELAMQIAETWHKLVEGTEFRGAIVVGGLSETTQLNAIRRGVDMVIATPGRLEDFLSRRLIDLGSVSVLALDEADRMLDMGFLPAIEKILAKLPSARQNLFFSATMDNAVSGLIARHSRDAVRIAVGGTQNQAADQVELHWYEIEKDRKVGLLRWMLEQEEGAFLVFARTKHGADRLAKSLSQAGAKAAAIHGNRTQNQRNQALDGFREGRYRVLVATDVVARGIHVDSVAHVVNFDLPQAPQDFIHRIGRTGRAGQSGTATTFSTSSERGEIRRIERECRVSLVRRRDTGETPEAKHLELFEPADQRPHRTAGHHAAKGASQNGAPGGFRPKRSFGRANAKASGRR
jgi:ATP-dependent RNA helicase RhlE